MPELNVSASNGRHAVDDGSEAAVVALMRRYPKLDYATATLVVGMRGDPTSGRWSDAEVLVVRASEERRFAADEDAVPEVAETTTKLGDVWELGEHRLLCGDSTDAACAARLMGGTKASLVATDPPYGVDFVRGQFISNPSRKFSGDVLLGIVGDSRKGQNQADFIQQVFEVARDHCLPGASVYMFSASMREGCYSMLGLCDASVHVQSQLIWDKGSMLLGQCDYQWRHEVIWYGWFDNMSHRWFGGRKQTTVLEFNKIAATYHPNEKPVKLVELMINNSSLPGEVVYEPFGGSGTAWIAAEKTGRRCFGMELDPHLCDTIVKRWEQYAGRKAERCTT